MGFNFSNYVKLLPFLQFVGLEVFVGGAIYERYHAGLGATVSVFGMAVSVLAFAYMIWKDGIKSLLPLPHLLMAAGYVALLAGLFVVRGERGELLAYLGSGVTMAGFAYTLLYP